MSPLATSPVTQLAAAVIGLDMMACSRASAPARRPSPSANSSAWRNC